MTATGPGAPSFTTITFRLPFDCLLSDPYAGGGVYDSFLVQNFPTQSFASIKPEIRIGVELKTADLSDDIQFGGTDSITATTTYATGTTYFGPLVGGIFGSHLGDIESGNPFVVALPFTGVPVGVPLQLSIDLQTQIHDAYGFPAQGGTWQSLAMVHCVMNFASAAVPVALVPAGLSVDSPGAGIDDGFYDPVPEPGTLVRLLPGCLALAGIAAARRPRLTGTTPVGDRRFTPTFSCRR